jgi:TIR domain/HEAT repeats
LTLGVIRKACTCAAYFLWLLPPLGVAQDMGAITRELGDESARVRRNAAITVYNANESASAAVPKLLSMLASERDGGVRELVVQALGAAGKHVTAVPPALAQLLKEDPAPRIRALAATALADLATAAEISVPALITALADPSADVRQAAALALGEFPGSAESIVPALVPVVTDKAVASAALKTLARFEAGAAAALPAVMQLVVAPDTNDVRLQAVQVLGSIGGAAASAAPECVKLLSNADPELRVEAAAALLAFDLHVDQALKTLVAALGFNLGQTDHAAQGLRNDVAARAAWVLGHYGAVANGEVLIGLASAANDPDKNEIREYAAHAFDDVLPALVKARRFDAIDSLVDAQKFLAQSQDESLRARSRQVAATIEELERFQPASTAIRRFAVPMLGAMGAFVWVLIFVLRRRRAGASRLTSPRLFISYRRQDSAASCGRLYDRLVADLGVDRVFRDIDSIAPGALFADRLRLSVAECDAFIVLIGPSWLGAADREGRRRLDDPADYVRLEIEAALEGGKPVFPVLVEGARMPRASELPPSVAQITASNAIEISDRHFSADTRNLLVAVRSVTAMATDATPAR